MAVPRVDTAEGFLPDLELSKLRSGVIDKELGVKIFLYLLWINVILIYYGNRRTTLQRIVCTRRPICLNHPHGKIEMLNANQQASSYQRGDQTHMDHTKYTSTSRIDDVFSPLPRRSPPQVASTCTWLQIITLVIC